MESSSNKPEISSASRVVALLLCWLLGFLGVHRFYLGKWFSGFLMLALSGSSVGTFIYFVLKVGVGEDGSAPETFASMNYLMGCFYVACAWAFIDLMRIITGNFRDGKGRKVFKWVESDSV